MTEGKPRLVDVLPQPGHDEAEVLRLAASLERGSEHPLAEAIVRGAEERDVKMDNARDFEAITGKGVKGVVGGKAVALGNLAMIRELGLEAGALTAKANARRDEGETVMFVVLDGDIAGLVAVADPVKKSTPAAIKDLHELGFRVIMATGDNERTANAIGARLGIDEIRADVLPEDKARIIRELQEAGHRVAMAGDGVNDAPAGTSRCRHRHGHWRRCGHRKRGHHAGQGQPRRYRACAAARPGHYAQHPPEPVLRADLQRLRRAGRGGSSVSLLWHPHQSDVCCLRHERVVNLGGAQFAAPSRRSYLEARNSIRTNQN